MQISNLKITLNNTQRVLIDKFSFSLKEDDKAVIIGEEGNGKSTLLRALYSAKDVSAYATIEGTISTQKHIGYLAQELPTSLSAKTIYEFFSENPLFFDLSPKELNEISFQLCLREGFFYSDQVISTLSGGEKVKLQLADILMKNPDLLLLDEPSNDLDISTLLWLEDFINNVDCPVIFISHDQELIENTANAIIHIEQIDNAPRITVARCGYEEYIQARSQQIVHQTQMAEKEQSQFKAKMLRWREIYQKVEKEQRNISRSDPIGGRLLKKKMKTVKAQERRYEKEKAELTQVPKLERQIKAPFGSYEPLPNGKLLLDFHLDKLYAQGRLLSQNISFSVSGNPHIAIIGDNGIGKTTLLRKIVDELKTKPFVKLGYMPQNYIEQLPLDLTPLDFLVTDGDKQRLGLAQTYLACLRFTVQEMRHKIGELSGGQKAKLLYLKIIFGDFNVLVLDEPTRNFSPLSCPVIRSTLSEYKGTIISISHDRKYIEEVCNIVYQLTPQGLKVL